MCIDCQSFLDDVNKFVTKAIRIKSMFNAVISTEQRNGSLNSSDLNLIRAQYNLDPIIEFHPEHEAFQIKLEKDDKDEYIIESDIFQNNENPLEIDTHLLINEDENIDIKNHQELGLVKEILPHDTNSEIKLEVEEPESENFDDKNIFETIKNPFENDMESNSDEDYFDHSNNSESFDDKKHESENADDPNSIDKLFK